MLEGPEQTAIYFDATTDEAWRADHPDWSSGLRRAPVVLLAYASPEAYVARYGEADKAASGLGDGPEHWPVPYWTGDAAFGVMTVLLAAVDAGLGACMLGAFRGEAELAESARRPRRLAAVLRRRARPPRRQRPPSSSLDRSGPDDDRSGSTRGRWA